MSLLMQLGFGWRFSLVSLQSCSGGISQRGGSDGVLYLEDTLQRNEPLEDILWQRTLYGASCYPCGKRVQNVSLLRR
jgi:hypothetical protein